MQGFNQKNIDFTNYFRGPVDGDGYKLHKSCENSCHQAVISDKRAIMTTLSAYKLIGHNR